MGASLVEIASPEGLYRLKWEWERERTGYSDLLSFGTADMDFRTPAPVLDALKAVLDRGHLGYPGARESFYEAIERHFGSIGWHFDARSSVAQNVGIYMSALSAIESFTSPGDMITILTPVHFCFRRMIVLNGRIPIECPIIQGEDGHSIDLARLEACLKSGSRMIWLCNPHNPIGHAWSREELEKVAKLAIANDALIISDDVYSDLMFPGHRYTPIASLSKEIAYRTATFHSTSKAFNTTGLKHSFAVIENPELFRKYMDTLERQDLEYGLSIMGMAAVEAAYRECGQWLEELMAGIAERHSFISSYVSENIPQLKVLPSNAGYFAWIDMRALGMDPKSISYTLETEEHMILANGAELGKGGAGFSRMNLATSMDNIREGAERLRRFAERHS